VLSFCITRSAARYVVSMCLPLGGSVRRSSVRSQTAMAWVTIPTLCRNVKRSDLKNELQRPILLTLSRLVTVRLLGPNPWLSLAGKRVGETCVWDQQVSQGLEALFRPAWRRLLSQLDALSAHARRNTQHITLSLLLRTIQSLILAILSCQSRS